MKKILRLFVLTMTVITTMTACQSDELGDVARKEVTVTIGVQPETMVQTRAGETLAIPAGYNLRYILEVWTDGKFYSRQTKTVQAGTTDTGTEFTVNLLAGHKSDLLFWADFTNAEKAVDDYFYVTNANDPTKGLKAVTKGKYFEFAPEKTDYKMADMRDAFYYAKTFDTSTENLNQNQIIKLKRAMSQLNIYTKNSDYKGVPADHKPTYTTVAINAPKSFNVMTGTGTTELTEWKANVQINPTAEDKDIKIDGQAVQEEVSVNKLFTGYYFTTSNGTETNDVVDFTAYFYNGENTEKAKIDINNIPMRKNYRTNIYGELLMDNATFTVNCDPGFENDEKDVEVTNPAPPTTPGVFMSLDGTDFENIDFNSLTEEQKAAINTAEVIKIVTKEADPTYVSTRNATTNVLTPDMLFNLMSLKPAKMLVLDLKDAIYQDNDADETHVAFPSHQKNTSISPFNVEFPESKLSKIIVPDNATKINVAGESSWNMTFKTDKVNPNLSSIEWNVDKVTVLSCYALTGQNSNITIPSLSKIKSIGPRTFYYSKIAGEIDLSSCTDIGEQAFRHTSLTHIKGWENIKKVGDYAFTDATNLVINEEKTLDLSNCESIGKFSFSGITEGIETVVIGSKLKEIPRNAFKALRSLKSVKFDNANTELVIREGAFQAAKAKHNLESVEVKAAKMHPTAFVALNSLHTLTLETGLKLFDYTTDAEGKFTTTEEELTWKKENDGILFAKPTPTSVAAEDDTNEKWRLYTYPTCGNQAEEYEIPADVEALGYMAFYTNSTLKKISFAEGIGEVKFIRSYLYEAGATKPDDNTYLFTAMAKLEELDMSNATIKSLGGQTMYMCHELRKVSLPKGLESIGTNAFRDCFKLETIICATATPPTLQGTDIFKNCGTQAAPANRKAYVPYGSLEGEKGYKGSEFYNALTDLDYTFEELPAPTTPAE